MEAIHTVNILDKAKPQFLEACLPVNLSSVSKWSLFAQSAIKSYSARKRIPSSYNSSVSLKLCGSVVGDGSYLKFRKVS